MHGHLAMTDGAYGRMVAVCQECDELRLGAGGGGESFKQEMQHLESASRRVADAHLHMPIRNRESLPNAQLVNCGQQFDVLLAEIVRTVK